MSQYQIQNIPGRSPSKTGVWYKSIIGSPNDPLAAAICINKAIGRADIAICELDYNLLFNQVFKQLDFMFNELKVQEEEQLDFNYWAERPDDNTQWVFKREEPQTPVENKEEFLRGFENCNYKRILFGKKDKWVEDQPSIMNSLEARIGIDTSNKDIYIGVSIYDDFMLLFRAYKEIMNGFEFLNINIDDRKLYHIHEDNIRSATGSRMKAIKKD